MQSSSSIAINGSEPNLFELKNYQVPEVPLPPTTAVVQLAPERDPFMVQISKDDPKHPMVCIPRPFFLWLAGIDLIFMGDT